MPGSEPAFCSVSHRKPSRESPAVVMPMVMGFHSTFWPFTPASQTDESRYTCISSKMRTLKCHDSSASGLLGSTMIRAPVSVCEITSFPMFHCSFHIGFSLICVAIFSKRLRTWSLEDATTPYWPLWMTSIVAMVMSAADANSVFPTPDGRQKMNRRYLRRNLPPSIRPQANMGFHMFSRWNGSSRNGFP